MSGPRGNDPSILSAVNENISDELFNELVIPHKVSEENSLHDDKKMHIWIPKGICLISENPYYDFFSTILVDLWFTLFVDKQSTSQSKQRFIVEQFVK